MSTVHTFSIGDKAFVTRNSDGFREGEIVTIEGPRIVLGIQYGYFIAGRYWHEDVQAYLYEHQLRKV